MAGTNRKVRYLPLFYDDLNQTLEYTAGFLGNQKAATLLLDSVENAILERLPVADAFEPYHSLRERECEYYRIYVRNYVIYGAF